MYVLIGNLLGKSTVNRLTVSTYLSWNSGAEFRKARPG